MIDNSPPAPSLANRREASRPRALLSGMLVFGPSQFTADCTIRDLTEQGARVRVRDDIVLPEPIWLIHLNSGKAQRAVVAWREPPDLGLRFEETVDLSTPITGGPLYRLHRLWIDSTGR
jgi:hypothetical protein